MGGQAAQAHQAAVPKVQALGADTCGKQHVKAAGVEGLHHAPLRLQEDTNTCSPGPGSYVQYMP